jgi:hypothetical protein
MFERVLVATSFVVLGVACLPSSRVQHALLAFLERAARVALLASVATAALFTAAPGLAPPRLAAVVREIGLALSGLDVPVAPGGHRAGVCLGLAAAAVALGLPAIALLHLLRSAVADASARQRQLRQFRAATEDVVGLAGVLVRYAQASQGSGAGPRAGSGSGCRESVGVAVAEDDATAPR